MHRFSKAFDKVDHIKLCIKLEHYIWGKLLDWSNPSTTKGLQSPAYVFAVNLHRIKFKMQIYVMKGERTNFNASN